MKRAFFILLILLLAAVGYGFYHTTRAMGKATRTEQKLMQEALERKKTLIDETIEETSSFPEQSKIVTEAVEILQSERDRVEAGEQFYEALGDIETVGAYYGVTMKKMDVAPYEEAMKRYRDAQIQVQKLRTTIPGKWLAQWGG